MTYGYVTPYRRPLSWKRFRNEGSDMLSDLNRQINDLFDDVFDFGSDDRNEETRLRGRRANAPVMEIVEDDERYSISAEMPGVKPEDVELTVNDGMLTLTGEKKRTHEDTQSGWSERSYGIYQRNLQLPQDIDEDAIEADFRDGVVNIALPRVAKKAKGRRIELKTASKKSESTLIDDNTNKVLENA